MSKRQKKDEFRRAGMESPAAKSQLFDRWQGKAILLGLSVLLLTLSFAPIHLFFLAWIGLVPWLLMVRHCASPRSVFLWSWVAGILFFLANMWWLAFVTLSGMIGLMFILGLQWGWAGLIVRGLGLASPGRGQPLRVLGIAVIWVATEWFRGSFPWDGLPWLYLGHTQTPVLTMCQIADCVGVAGVSFWVVLINSAVAMLVIHRLNLRPCLGSIALALIALGCTLTYGLYRFSEQTLIPGPRVMVVQSNYPQSNTGDKGAPLDQIVSFHVRTTRAALQKQKDVDLVVWSETMMPPLNRSARQCSHLFKYGEQWNRAHLEIMDIAYEFNVGLLVGSAFYDDWDYRDAADRRNSVYFYEPGGLVSDKRYDKIHLVPFGEFMPFKHGMPLIYRLLMKFSPYDFDYSLTPGPRDQLTVFTLKGWRFVTPICFEDIDAWLVARMFRSNEGKRADVVVNLTNDGWFKFNQMPQHLQAAVFRSIETRAPTARSVNTGISGFIDSLGQPHDLIPSGTEGVSTAQLKLDSRFTIFTRMGEWFAKGCAVIASVLAIGGIASWTMKRKSLRNQVR